MPDFATLLDNLFNEGGGGEIIRERGGLKLIDKFESQEDDN